VPTTVDAAHAIAHNKIIINDIIDIIDEEMVITGSFNFTKAAQEENAENLLIIRDPALAAYYTQNWQAHAQHSQPYVDRGVRW
jgi:phosphatidylserine/phosphatidylglycerophosphate/cardiolipin synthase-like enzyme